MKDWWTGVRYFTLYQLRTVAFTAVTVVAIVMVWYVGHRSNERLNHQAHAQCQQVLQLTNAVNNFHRTFRKLLVVAEARAKQQGRPYKVYVRLANSIAEVPDPPCVRKDGHS